ncbi:hypothetical protein PSECIP111951_01787 [Pseudoalteromonas holothuriae]|uniref:Uncharacterized protein n=1 Tax=Pseudoalteromonas holothuriae TaxID=2963714 RepID=A0A9W4QYB1_9GAMM|nr:MULTISPECIES: hypothetical protein [unclassified Pseudoalteromonas]CAH9058029.1 hypothetical protein PSECIP111951_01787 [Pseudoalteromonas sp. CIP111951]CAH9058658.1 hypothetical protein PSECIP111854_02247 [Pseudoalteromonas sp. CIP111854]
MKIKLKKKNLKTLSSAKEINSLETNKIAGGDEQANSISWTSRHVLCYTTSLNCPHLR